MNDTTPRTRFLIENPDLIDAIGLQNGVPARDLDDFRQTVLLRSLEYKDDFDPAKPATLKTYSIRFIVWSVKAFLSENEGFPILYDDPEEIPDQENL